MIIRKHDVVKKGYHFLFLKLELVYFFKGFIGFLYPIHLILEWGKILAFEV